MTSKLWAFCRAFYAALEDGDRRIAFGRGHGPGEHQIVAEPEPLDRHAVWPVPLNGRAAPPFLWINRYGGQLGYATFHTLFDRMGRRTIGKPISVHATRYAYAGAVLNADPRDAEVAGVCAPCVRRF